MQLPLENSTGTLPLPVKAYSEDNWHCRIKQTHPDQGKDNKRGPRKRKNSAEVVNHDQLPVQGHESRKSMVSETFLRSNTSFD